MIIKSKLHTVEKYNEVQILFDPELQANLFSQFRCTWVLVETEILVPDEVTLSVHQLKS